MKNGKNYFIEKIIRQTGNSVMLRKIDNFFNNNNNNSYNLIKKLICMVR